MNLLSISRLTMGKQSPIASFLLYLLCILGIPTASAIPSSNHGGTELPNLYTPFGETANPYEFRQVIPSLIAEKDAFYDQSVNSASTTKLSLEDCIRLAFENNPGLQRTIANLRSSKDLLIAAQRAWNPTFEIQSSSLPTITYSESYTGDNRPNQTAYSLNSTISGQERAELSATLNWKFLDFSRQPNINSLSSAYYAQEYVYISFSRSLIAQVQSEYFNLLSLSDLVRSYTLIVDSQLENAKAIDAKFSAGRVSLLDVGQVYSQLYNSMTSLVSYINQYYEASSRISSLIALPEYNLIVPAGDNEFFGRWPLDLTASIQSAVTNNEKIKTSLESALESRWNGVTQLNSALPYFYLGATAAWRSSNKRSSIYQSTSNEPSIQSSLPWDRSSNLSAFLGFRWQLYQGGVNNATASSSFNRSKSFLYQASDDKYQLISQIRSSYNSLDANSLAFKSADAAVYSAQTAYGAALARLRAGLSDITTVNQTIQAYQNGIQSRATSIRDYNIALSELYNAAAIWPPNTESFAVGQLSSAPDPELDKGYLE